MYKNISNSFLFIFVNLIFYICKILKIFIHKLLLSADHFEPLLWGWSGSAAGSLRSPGGGGCVLGVGG